MIVDLHLEAIAGRDKQRQTGEFYEGEADSGGSGHNSLVIPLRMPAAKT